MSGTELVNFNESVKNCDKKTKQLPEFVQPILQEKSTQMKGQVVSSSESDSSSDEEIATPLATQSVLPIESAAFNKSPLNSHFNSECVRYYVRRPFHVSLNKYWL